MGQLDKKYLGVTLYGGKTLRFDCKTVIQSFFAACNCIYAQAKQLDEIIHVSLQESYCLPILALKQVDELNACWNSVFRRIFGFHKYESVKDFVCGLGRLDLRIVIRIRRVKFYCHVLGTNHRLLNDIFWINLTNPGDDNDLISSVYSHVNVICSGIYEHFRAICS